MTEFIHSVAEPKLIGTFDAEEAQEFVIEKVDTLGKIPDGRIGFDSDVTAKLMCRFAMQLDGLTTRQREDFTDTAESWVEQISIQHKWIDVVDHLFKPISRTRTAGENLWHADRFEFSKNTGKPVDEPFYELLSLQIGSSSHCTEIISGDVRFDRDILDYEGFEWYLLADEGQQAIDNAIQRGDAWVFNPNYPAEGKIFQFAGPSLHRRRQSAPANDYRFAVRNHLDNS